MRRWRGVVIFAAIGVAAYFVYLEYRLPPGMQPMGENDETIAWLGLYAAIAGALASFFSLLKDVIGLFKMDKSE